MKLLVLLSDAFGGRGGIAKFNRDLLRTVCAHGAFSQVIALPRLLSESPGVMPDNLDFDTESARGLRQYLGRTARSLGASGVRGVVVGHINLLPLGALAAWRFDAPLLLMIHGIEAWEKHPRVSVRRSLRAIDAVVAVSEFTKRRFLHWADVDENRVAVIPNCVDLSQFTPGPKRHALLQRYEVQDRTILLTVGRLSSGERYKGIDTVIELLPRLCRAIPRLCYLIVGDGDDRPRLQHVVNQLGLSDRVRFAGYVPENEKADYYRLADAFVMPGTGEGFGLVYLEAMACGIPVVASSADASCEAVLGGALGEVVNPRDRDDVEAGILRALRRPVGLVPTGLQQFSTAAFEGRWRSAIDDVFCRRTHITTERRESALTTMEA